jgi:hypothetical protein
MAVVVDAAVATAEADPVEDAGMITRVVSGGRVSWALVGGETEMVRPKIVVLMMSKTANGSRSWKMKL